MRTIVNDLEPHIPAQRLFSELQYSTNSFLSCGSAAIRWPISNHSFDWQPENEITPTVEVKLVNSETVTAWSLNISDDFLQNISMVV
jgi:hypothetical protein